MVKNISVLIFWHRLVLIQTKPFSQVIEVALPVGPLWLQSLGHNHLLWGDGDSGVKIVALLPQHPLRRCRYSCPTTTSCSITLGRAIWAQAVQAVQVEGPRMFLCWKYSCTLALRSPQPKEPHWQQQRSGVLEGRGLVWGEDSSVLTGTEVNVWEY